jgi:DNA-directed RNA polymerase subunit RPC12/RpoP
MKYVCSKCGREKDIPFDVTSVFGCEFEYVCDNCSKRVLMDLLTNSDELEEIELPDQVKCEWLN